VGYGQGGLPSQAVSLRSLSFFFLSFFFFQKFFKFPSKKKKVPDSERKKKKKSREAELPTAQPGESGAAERAYKRLTLGLQALVKILSNNARMPCAWP
jgi:hypothetical protein